MVGDCMAHDIVYGICENKCQVETISKEEFENSAIKCTIESQTAELKYAQLTHKNVDLYPKVLVDDCTMGQDGAGILFAYPGGKSGTKLTSGKDLNSILVPGYYVCVDSDITASLVNCPVSSGTFKLIVEYGPTTGQIIQTIKQNVSIYYRYINPMGSVFGGSAFSSWYKVTAEAVT